jgi:hypothetical protein
LGQFFILKALGCWGLILESPLGLSPLLRLTSASSALNIGWTETFSLRVLEGARPSHKLLSGFATMITFPIL